MPSFGAVDVITWEDEDFRVLEGDSRLVFLWSWTNRRATICGLYSASLRQMTRAIGWANGSPAAWRNLEDRVVAVLPVLGAKPMLKYDDEAEVVWVVNRARHANRSPKTQAAMAKEFRDCPPSPLRDEFAAMYPTIGKDPE